MTSIGREIRIFKEEAEESVNVIIDGSDEHLDQILSIINPLNSITKRFTALNEMLFEHLPKCSKETIKVEILPELMDINRLCMTYIGAIRTSLMYRDVRLALKKFHTQHQLLIETIHDLHYLIISDDNELDNILKEISDN